MNVLWSMWYKHFLFGFVGSVFVFLLSIWLMAWSGEKHGMRMSDQKVNVKSIVYHILELLGITGTISFGLLGMYEFIYSFILGCKLIWGLIFM